jgi:prevent-host-death family protein
MQTVGIAELKSRLSEYLRRVRRGHPITVMDRETPIARIVPFEPAPEPLPVRRPLSSAPLLRDVELPPPLRLDRDIVDLLLEERQGER